MTESTHLCSMTGFGRASVMQAGLQLTVEIKSVNHRYCEVKIRTPQDWGHLELPLKKQLQASLKRGRVEVSLRLEQEEARALKPSLNLGQAHEYQRLFDALCKDMGLPRQSLDPQALFAMPGVLTTEAESLSEEEVETVFHQAFAQALSPFLEMRRREGDHLKQDLLTRIETLEEGVVKLREIAVHEPALLAERVKSRLEHLLPELGVPAVEPQRLHQEIAILAEKADVTEELTRLESHLQQFRELLDAGGEVGRRLDFLCQEIHRELNTFGSKSGHPDTATVLIPLKAEGNKIREQVQNLE